MATPLTLTEIQDQARKIERKFHTFVFTGEEAVELKASLSDLARCVGDLADIVRGLAAEA